MADANTPFPKLLDELSELVSVYMRAREREQGLEKPKHPSPAATERQVEDYKAEIRVFYEEEVRFVEGTAQAERNLEAYVSAMVDRVYSPEERPSLVERVIQIRDWCAPELGWLIGQLNRIIDKLAATS